MAPDIRHIMKTLIFFKGDSEKIEVPDPLAVEDLIIANQL